MRTLSKDHEILLNDVNQCTVAVCQDVCGQSMLLHKQSVHAELTHAIRAVCGLVKTGLNLKGPKVVGKSR